VSQRFRRAGIVLVNSPIVAGLVGASFGLVLANLSSSHQSGPPRWALVGVFMAAILSASVVYNRLEVMGRKVDGLQNSTDLIRLDQQSGGMDLVVGLVENASVIRVIGRARQDQLSRPESPQFNYLKATEVAVKSGSLKVYRRITGTELKPAFQQHLARLLENQQAGHIVQIAAIPEIDAMISYQTFDSTAAIIGVETAAVPGIRDSTIVFLTHRSDIIEALTAHFDSAWLGLQAINTSSEFEAATSVVA
jgi:hypothetical protein